MAKTNAKTKTIQLTIPYHQSLTDYLAQNHPDIQNYHILSQSLDARDAPRGRVPRYHYVLEYWQGEGEGPFSPSGTGMASKEESFKTAKKFRHPPLIVGAGPAGLFCALRFSEYGIPSIILERGDSAQKRMGKIARFWRYGELDEDTNVCFGEGGAGLFSDGKLLTRIKSPFVPYIMKKFVDYGAPPQVAWASNPHLGSHRIRQIISTITAGLKQQGHCIRYNHKVVGLIQQDKVVKGVVLEDGQQVFFRPCDPGRRALRPGVLPLLPSTPNCPKAQSFYSGSTNRTPSQGHGSNAVWKIPM